VKGSTYKYKCSITIKVLHLPSSAMLQIWLTCSSFRCFAKPIRVQSGSSGFSNKRISDKLAVAHFRRSLFDDSEASFHWLLVLLVDLSLAFSSMATQLSVISQKLIQIKVLISVYRRPVAELVLATFLLLGRIPPWINSNILTPKPGLRLPSNLSSHSLTDVCLFFSLSCLCCNLRTSMWLFRNFFAV